MSKMNEKQWKNLYKEWYQSDMDEVIILKVTNPRNEYYPLELIVGIMQMDTDTVLYYANMDNYSYIHDGTGQDRFLDTIMLILDVDKDMVFDYEIVKKRLDWV